MKNYSDNVSYTDNQSIVKLIQGSILSQSDLDNNKKQPSSTIQELKSKQDVINENLANKAEPKDNVKVIKEVKNNEKNNDLFDPFDSINVGFKEPKEQPKQKIDSQKLDALSKAIEYADKSISNIENISNVKPVFGGEKKGNAKENAMPGKYDKYKGMVNRRLNEIWGFYRPQNQNMIKVKIKINSVGMMEILSYDRVENEDFMNNINKFFDKIQKENFGTPPNGEEMILDILLQTNENKQGIVVE